MISEILCTTCLRKGKRRRREQLWVFPCNHVFCEEHGNANLTSCPECGGKGAGKVVNFARLQKFPGRWQMLVTEETEKVFEYAERALDFWEKNNRNQQELEASKIAYKNLSRDHNQLKMESDKKIEALHRRLAERPLPLPSPARRLAQTALPPPGGAGAVPSPMRSPDESLGSLQMGEVQMSRKRPYNFSEISMLSLNRGRR